MRLSEEDEILGVDFVEHGIEEKTCKKREYCKKKNKKEICIQYSNVPCKKCENSKEIGIQYSSILWKKRENSKEVGIQYASVLSNNFSVEEGEKQRKVIVFEVWQVLGYTSTGEVIHDLCQGNESIDNIDNKKSRVKKKVTSS